jgi:hypothetical protein
MTRFEGQMISTQFDPQPPVTNTGNWQRLVWPWATAVQVTIVAPMGNCDPEGGKHENPLMMPVHGLVTNME